MLGNLNQAFPSSGGVDERSTYLFTYLKPGAEMPSLLDVMEDYWRALPACAPPHRRFRAQGTGHGAPSFPLLH